MRALVASVVPQGDAAVCLDVKLDGLVVRHELVEGFIGTQEDHQLGVWGARDEQTVQLTPRRSLYPELLAVPAG